MWHSPPVWETAFFNDVSSTAEVEGSRTSQTFEKTGKEWGEKIKNKFNETVKNWNLDSIKQKGLDAVNNLTSGLKMGEGGLLSEVNFLNGILGQLANARNLAARGYSSTLQDFEDSVLKPKRKDLINQRSQIDYVNGTKAQREEYKRLNDQIGEYDNKLKKNAEMIGKATEASQKLDLELNNNAESFGKAGKGAGGAAKEMENFASKLEQTLEGQMNIFQKFEKKEAMSKDELLANMRSQIQGMTEWAAQMQTLAARGLDQGLYEELAMMGPQGAEYVGAFAQMTSEELAQANQLWAQSLVLPKNVANQVAGAFNNIGQNLMAGEAAGIRAGATDMLAAQSEVQQKGIDTANEINQTHSPSRVFEEIGKFLMQGLAAGIKAHGGEAVTQVKKICSDIISAAKSALSYSDFYNIGVNLINGITAGLKDKEAIKKLKARLSELASLMEDGEKKPNKIDSPSKLWRDEIGKNLVLGLAEGLRMYAGEAVNAAEELAGTTLDSMKDTIAGIGQMLNNDVEDPVIKPVLDLSDVEEGARTLNNMFSTTQALNASASISDLQNGQLNGSKLGTTFIQNNYSPKALSRVEIYRQTRNQFSAYREAMQ